MTARRGLILCLISFVVSRFFYLALLKVPFDDTPLTYFLQYLDLGLLKNQLWESLYYLHSQPPGFNLFLGIVLKAFPERYALVFQLVFIGLGLLYAVSLFTLMVRLGVSIRISSILAVIFSCSPVVVLFENWLFYPYPTAVLLCVAAVLLHRLVLNARLYNGLAFFSVLALIASIRGTYHLVWFVFFCLLIFQQLKEHRRTVALSFCLPLLLLSSLYAKNYILFGAFSTGDMYTAINLKIMTYYEIPKNEHDALIAQGKLTRMSLISPGAYGKIESFMDIIGPTEKTGVAVLDDVRKSSHGGVNLDYAGYLKAAKLMSQDSKYFLRERPDVYLLNVIRSYGEYFRPASEFRWDRDPEGRYARVHVLDRMYSVLLLGELSTKPGTAGLAFCLVLGLPVLMAFGVYAGAQAYRRHDSAAFMTVTFLIGNVLYVTLLSSLLAGADHSRYRFDIDGLYIALLGLFIRALGLRGVIGFERRRPIPA